MKNAKLLICGLIISMIISILLPDIADAQLTRERVETDEPVYNVFWANTNIGIGTVRNLAAKNLNSTILHTFGPVSEGIDQFFGLDFGANTRIGIDYGLSDRTSVGIGRMTFNKVVDLRGKYNILRQTPSKRIPLELAVKTSVGINTMSELGYGFQDRLSYFTSIMIARKFNKLSLQLTPMFAHFNSVTAGNRNQLAGLGILASLELNDRFSISAEYLPLFSERNRDTNNALAVALNIDSGGHIFQLFFTSSQWHGEQYIMANNRNEFLNGDFRFGFNINRVFGLGGK
jgi:hypothetical protein